MYGEPIIKSTVALSVLSVNFFLVSLSLSDAKDLPEILEVRIVAFAFVDFISNAIRRSLLDCGT